MNITMETIFCFCACFILSNAASIRERVTHSTGGDRAVKSIGNTDSPKTCFDALNECKHDKTCRETLKELKIKCAIRAGTCNAGMRDLPVCARVMDAIMTKHFNPDLKCVCNKNPERCSRIHETIYDNPCFSSVKLLRRMNMLPRLELMSKPNQITKYETKTKLNNIVDELLDEFLSNNDSISDGSSSTTDDMTTVTSQDIIIPEEIKVYIPSTNDVTNGHDDVTNAMKTPMEPIYIVTRKEDYLRDDKTTNGSPHNQTLLLHVVAIATGVLMVVMLTIGSALLVYFSIGRKTNNQEKSPMTT